MLGSSLHPSLGCKGASDAGTSGSGLHAKVIPFRRREDQPRLALYGQPAAAELIPGGRGLAAQIQAPVQRCSRFRGAPIAGYAAS
jgi:hypothetical protein